MHSLTCTQVAMPSLTCTQVAMHSLTCTQVATHSLTCTQVAMPSLTCTQVAMHSLTCTQVAMPSLTCTQVAMHSLTCTQVAQLSEKDELSWSRKQLLARMDVAMGGRVAEEMVFGDDNVTSGMSPNCKSRREKGEELGGGCNYNHCEQGECLGDIKNPRPRLLSTTCI